MQPPDTKIGQSIEDSGGQWIEIITPTRWAVDYVWTREEEAKSRSVSGNDASTRAPQVSPETQPIAQEPAPVTEPRGFARLEVDEDAAERALERTLLQTGALLLPSWRMQFAPSVAYSFLQSDFPSVLGDGDELVLGSGDRKRTVVNANLDLRIGLPFGSQLELGIPYRWVDEEISGRVQGTPIGQSSSRNGHDLGSFEIGLAKTLFRERGWRPDIVGRIRWDTGSGDDFDNESGLGSDVESVGASLTFIKRSDPLVFVGSINYRTFSEEGSVELGDQFGVSFGTALAVSPMSSLFASVNNQFLAKTRRNGARIDGSDANAYSLSLGASTLLTKGVLFSLTSSIGISDDAPDYSLVLEALCDPLVGKPGLLALANRHLATSSNRLLGFSSVAEDTGPSIRSAFSVSTNCASILV